MRLVTLVIVMALTALTAAAQPADLKIDSRLPDGKALQEIGSTEDAAQQAALIEEFLKQYPDHDGAEWVLTLLAPAYAKLNQPGKSLAACEMLVEKETRNSAAVHGCLKTAEAQKDPDLIQKWAVETHAAAKRAVEAPKPEFEFEEDEETWNQNIDFAKQVGSYAEWSIYNTVLTTPDPAKKASLFAALKEVNPESEYLSQMVPVVFMAYLQAGQTEPAVAMAEEAVAAGQASDDMLIVVADHYTRQKDYAKATEYAEKVIAYYDGAAPAEGVSPEEFEQKKKTSLGKAHFMIGSAQSAQGQYKNADATLRKGLPFFQGDDALLPAALFHLGVANYQLGNATGNEKRILAAFEYTTKCANMKSPYQAQAKKNLSAIQSQYRIRK